MLPAQKNLHLPAEMPLYFDDFITRDNYKAAQRRPPVQLSLMPATNVYETAESFFIEMVVPGVSYEELEFFVTDRSIEIRYKPENGEYAPMNSSRVWHTEYHPAAFKRKFEFNPEIFDIDNLQVDSLHGVTRIEIPKQEAYRGRMTPLMPFSLN